LCFLLFLLKSTCFVTPFFLPSYISHLFLLFSLFAYLLPFSLFTCSFILFLFISLSLRFFSSPHLSFLAIRFLF
jgi:hypothetical protein